MLIYKEKGMVEIIKALIKKYGRKKIFVLRTEETALALQRQRLRYLNQLLKQTQLIQIYQKKHT